MSLPIQLYLDALGVADALLESHGPPPSPAQAHRLRLARDVLATKLLKLEAIAEAERLAELELDEAVARLELEARSVYRSNQNFG